MDSLGRNPDHQWKGFGVERVQAAKMSDDLSLRRCQGERCGTAACLVSNFCIPASSVRDLSKVLK